MHYYLLFLLFFLSITFSVKSQISKDIVEKHNSSIFVEKLTVSTDRDIYISGESVFLAIEKTDAFSGKRVNTSKIVYVEFFNKAKIPVIQLKAIIDQFTGVVRFRIPDTISTGNYMIRAYTLWMKNFSPNYYAYKQITILNPFKQIESLDLASEKATVQNIRFYPEGGHIINNTTNKIAFVAFDDKDYPMVSDTLSLYVNSVKTQSIITNTKGAGQVNVNYSGLTDVYLQSGTGKIFPLPKPEQNVMAITYALNPEVNTHIFNLKYNNYPDNNKLHYLVVFKNGTVCLHQEVYPSEDSVIRITNSQLPDGKLTAVVYNKQGVKLSGRSFDNRQNRSAVDINIKGVDKEYATRSKVSFQISDLNKNLSDNFYVKLSAVKSDLFYPANLSDNKTDLDNLTTEEPDWMLLTKNPEWPVFVPELNGHIVSGQIKLSETENYADKDITCSFVGSGAECSFTTTDSTGHFYFETFVTGVREMVIQPIDQDVEKYYVDINPSFSAVYADIIPGRFLLDTANLQSITRSVINMQVEAVYENAGFNLNQKLTNNTFYANPDNIIYLGEYIELNNVREIIKEIVPEVSVIRKKEKNRFRMINRINSNYFKLGPLLLIDGIPIYAIDRVLDMNYKEITKIEIINVNYFMGNSAIEGIMHFYTKTGNLSGFEFNNNIFRQVYACMEPVSNVFWPDYQDAAKKASHIPDFRNTLFFNQKYYLSSNNALNYEFYTSDTPGTYKIAIEIEDNVGKTYTKDIYFEVK